MLARRFTVLINSTALKNISDALELKDDVTVLVEQGDNENSEVNLWGQYNCKTRRIRIVTCHNYFEKAPLSYVQNEFHRTLLHEMRHAHQQDHWSSEELIEDSRLQYSRQRQEQDANQWAATNQVLFPKVIKITKANHTGPSRLP